MAVFINSTMAQKQVTIKGTIKNNQDFTEISLKDIKGEEVYTSSKIIDDKFDLTYAGLAETKFCILQITDSEDYYVILIVDPGSTIEIEADLEDMFNPLIKGSPQSQLLYTTVKDLNNYDSELFEKTQQLEEEYATLKSEYLTKMINENTGSLAVLLFIEQLDIEEHIELYKKVDKQLMKKYPNDSLVLDFHNQIEQKSILDIGNKLPQIELYDQDSNLIKLSDIKAKYVLIDFWASWCVPCREEMPNLKTLYEKYQKEGFEIYGISVDQSKESWIEAMNEDKITWKNVFDINAEVATKLNIETIPYSILIDKKGKIIAKKLQGEELTKKMEELFD